MNNLNAVHGPVAGLAGPRGNPDDFDFEGWLENATLPMQLAPARVVRLKDWLEAQGFAAVEIRYKAKADKFRVIMERGAAHCCSNDDDVEGWLHRAAVACGSEADQLIGLLTADGKVLGSFKLSLPRATWRAEIGR
jgi:hypothetical protein